MGEFMRQNSKTTRLTSNRTMQAPLPKAGLAREPLNLGTADPARYPMRTKATFIHWPSEREIEQVSRSLAQVMRVGMSSEAGGDYFKSGDLAYQIREIMRATAELYLKCKRARK
jgi:hypothetical protein